MRILYCIDNKLGGVTSLNYNLAANKNDESVQQALLQIDCADWDMSKADISFPVDETFHFEFSEKDNYYQTLKRLHKAIPSEPGALVVNYDTEMAMLDHFPVKQTVYQLVHDNYNVKLAIMYGHIVDVFICHNSIIYQQLLDQFPERKNDIYFFPHGVKIPIKWRKVSSDSGPIELLFLGRMTESKGVYDLPVISEFLHHNGVDFRWTCIGNGPDLEKLKALLVDRYPVAFLSPKSNAEVLEICSTKDVFVLPTKFEGSPVSLIETMSVGLVPVISNLPGGITDIVDDRIGFKVKVDDNMGFANAITKLYGDRNLLNELSFNCREKIIGEYDVELTAKPYHELFKDYVSFYRQKKLMKKKVGARLDQKYLPNIITRSIRALVSK